MQPNSRNILLSFCSGNRQGVVDTVFMNEEKSKKKVGFLLPSVVADGFESVTGRLGKKQQWQAFSAAMIYFMSADEELQNDMIRQIAIANAPGGSFALLVEQAKHQAGILDQSAPIEKTAKNKRRVNR